MSQWLLSAYACSSCGPFESLELRSSPSPTRPCPDCASPGDLVEYAGFQTVNHDNRITAVATGKSDAHDNPNMLDTRPLAEGMPMKEWRAKQDKARVERRHKQMVKNGLVTPKVFVG